MEGLSVAGKTTTKEISQLKVDLCREVTARSSQKEELARLREPWKKGSEILEDSELQQKESALLAAQQAPEEMRQHAEGVEATLRFKRDAFEEAMEYLKNDLSRAQIAHDETEAREQEHITDCQHMLKVFKFKKYKEEYEDEKSRAPPKYSLDVGSFLKGKGQDPLESGATHAAEVEASQTLPLGMQCP